MALTQKEIIEFEESNRDVIRLYLEGTFLKAYERSTFAFCTRVKDFKVLRKESKTLGRDILYVGFPAAAVEPTLSGCKTRRVDERTIDVVLSYPIDENEFLALTDYSGFKEHIQELPESFRHPDERKCSRKSN